MPERWTIADPVVILKVSMVFFSLMGALNVAATKKDAEVFKRQVTCRVKDWKTWATAAAINEVGRQEWISMTLNAAAQKTFKQFRAKQKV